MVILSSSHSLFSIPFPPPSLITIITPFSTTNLFPCVTHPQAFLDFLLHLFLSIPTFLFSNINYFYFFSTQSFFHLLLLILFFLFLVLLSSSLSLSLLQNYVSHCSTNISVITNTNRSKKKTVSSKRQIYRSIY